MRANAFALVSAVALLAADRVCRWAGQGAHICDSEPTAALHK